jgi:hypothetical protein
MNRESYRFVITLYEQGVIPLGHYALWQEFLLPTQFDLRSTLHSLVTHFNRTQTQTQITRNQFQLSAINLDISSTTNLNNK